MVERETQTIPKKDKNWKKLKLYCLPLFYFIPILYNIIPYL